MAGAWRCCHAEADLRTFLSLPACLCAVDNSTFITRSSKAFGDFYRPLAPGKHNVTVALPGVRRASSVQTFTVTVPPSGAGAQLAVTFP